MPLSEDQLKALETTHRKIAVVQFSGHEIVFRRPTREECHAYRVAQTNPETGADALEQLSQRTLVAFDGNTDLRPAREAYTNTFLADYPMFANTPKALKALSALSGLFEAEDAADLGKGVSVRPSTLTSTPTASQNGSATAQGAPS